MQYIKYTLAGAVFLSFVSGASALSLQMDGSGWFNLNTDENATQTQAKPVKAGNLEASPLAWPLIKSFLDADTTSSEKGEIEKILKAAGQSFAEVKKYLAEKSITLAQAQEKVEAIIEDAAADIDIYISDEKEEKWESYIEEAKKIAKSVLAHLSEMNENRDQIQQNMDQMRQNWNEFREVFGNVTQYIKNNITAEEKAKVKEAVNTYREKLVTLRKQYLESESGSIDWASSVKTLFENFAAEITAYINPEKTEAFKAFIEAKMKVISTNIPLRAQNQDLRDDNSQIRQEGREQVNAFKRKLLSAALVAKLDAKLAKIPDEKKETAFKKILANIDKAIAKTDAAKKKALLSELRAYIQSKLDALTNDAEGELIIDEVLDGAVE